MIYTVTFNPSLDYIISVNNFKLGATNRTHQEAIYPGGKGINVSIVLSNLGQQNIALGFYAGFTGDKIVNLLKEANVDNKFIKLSDGASRINVKCKNLDINHEVIDETEINGLGPNINKEALDKFYQQIDMIDNEDILVLSGSIPSGVPNTIYKEIMQRLQNKQIKIVVDATKDLLTNVLEFKPFLIKPNRYEIEEIFGEKNISNEEIEHYAKELKKMGAVNVLVSNGNKESILIDEDEKLHMCSAPKGDVKNSVGSGDGMVAGFLYSYLKTNDYEQALRYAVCAGSACAFSDTFASEIEIMKLFNKM